MTRPSYRTHTYWRRYQPFFPADLRCEREADEPDEAHNAGHFPVEEPGIGQLEQALHEFVASLGARG